MSIIYNNKSVSMVQYNSAEMYSVFYNDTMVLDNLFSYVKIGNGYRISPRNKNALPANLTLPSTHEGLPVTSIAAYGFSNCPNLVNLTIPSSYTSLPENAFNSCPLLKTLTIEEGPTLLLSGGSIFSSCSSLETITIKRPLSGTSNSLFSGCSKLTSVTLPEGLSEIGIGWFRDCKALTSITLPSTITLINSSAFQSCSSLSSITLPSSLVTIGSQAFYYCSKLTSITLPASLTSIRTSAFDRSGITSIYYQGTVDDYVSKIEGFSNLIYGINKKLYINNELVTNPSIQTATKINPSSFYGMSDIKQASIGSSVTQILSQSFYYADLSSISIPNSVTLIDRFAFGYNKNLTSVSIGSSIQNIADYAFTYCSKLTSVTCRSTTPPSIGSNTFSGSNSLSSIYVPAESVDAYKTAWSKYSSIIKPL